MRVTSTEDFRHQMRSVMIRNDVEGWDLAVKIKNHYRLNSVFEVADLPADMLAPFIAQMILESNVDE